jgi:glyoxylase-like metal-dependent hydrolase (beta-lactamase superfamily II)
MPTSQSHYNTVFTLDLNFRGLPCTIAAYLIPHSHGAVLVETGPGSTLPALQAGLKAHGFAVQDVSDVLLTHIHLDHAGAAGWLARQGAHIHVHEVGAPHLRDPERLLASASRIYGDTMDVLWGEFLSVPAEKLSVLRDNQVVEVNGLQFRALDTPGHAYHHMAYLFGDVCFSGDIGGVRLAGSHFLRLPMPPPEFHLELWRQSLKRLQDEFERGSYARVAPTHFGISDDPAWHLSAIQTTLDETEQWMFSIMPANPSLEELREQIVAWNREQALRSGMSEAQLKEYEAANPTWMSAGGIYRYWHKVRNGP